MVCLYQRSSVNICRVNQPYNLNRKTDSFISPFSSPHGLSTWHHCSKPGIKCENKGGCRLLSMGHLQMVYFYLFRREVGVFLDPQDLYKTRAMFFVWSFSRQILEVTVFKQFMPWDLFGWELGWSESELLKTALTLMPVVPSDVTDATERVCSPRGRIALVWLWRWEFTNNAPCQMCGS